MSVDPSGWERFMLGQRTRRPSERQEAFAAEIARRLDGAVAELAAGDVKDRHAAGALAQLLRNDVARWKTERAMMTYAYRSCLPRHGRRGLRQGDVRNVAAEIAELRDRLGPITDKLDDLLRFFDGLPGTPGPGDQRLASADAYLTLADLADMAKMLADAVEAEHGPDVGGSPDLIARRAGDPFENLGRDLAAVWTGEALFRGSADEVHPLWRRALTRDCPSLSGEGWQAYWKALTAIHKALTGNDDLPKNAAARLRAKLRQKVK